MILFQKLRKKWADERFKFFYTTMKIAPGMKILDLGGSGGRYMDYLKKENINLDITIADMDTNALDIAKKKGYKTVLMDGSAQFPFCDKEFDIIFCNSVIEHVTIPKNEIWKLYNKFKEKALKSQTIFANEIIRCSKQYFVQTPHRYFPIEAHTQFPLVGYFDHSVRICLIKILNLFWIKKTSPDWHLLTKKEMELLFREGGGENTD
jgi:cyclopropane fatty-acyl-phospholipid synthase-like methyltransferase